MISNCVINLAPDKPAVFREIARVLKPGWRRGASDIALGRELPPEISRDLLAYVGCVAGAIPIEDYRRGLVEAGFSEVAVIDSGADLNAYAQVEGQSGCCSPPVNEEAAPRPAETAAAGAEVSEGLPLAAPSCCAPAASEPVLAITTCCAPAGEQGGELHRDLSDLLSRYNVNDYAASVKVLAVKRL